MRVDSNHGRITYNYPDGKGVQFCHLKSDDKVFVGLSNEHINVERLGYYPEDYVEHTFINKNGKYVSENSADIFDFDVDKSLKEVVNLFRRFRKA